jgi:hypothetical protein
VSAGGETVRHAPPAHHSACQEVWRASLPADVSSYAFTVQTATGPEAVRGPYTVPGELFTAVPWVGDAVGYQIFPERFWNGDPSNDHLALETDVLALQAPGAPGAHPAGA